MKVAVLSEEQAGQFTHVVELTHEDLTESTANTAQTIEILDVEAGHAVINAATRLVTPFEDSSDAAFNTTALTVGDGTDPDQFITSQELNENGTEVDYALMVSGGAQAFQVADTVDAVFGSMSAKSLSNIDTGKVLIYLQVVDLKVEDGL